MGGDEVPGVLLYGLDSTANDTEPRFPDSAWPWLVALKTYVFSGKRWRVRLWEVALSARRKSYRMLQPPRLGCLSTQVAWLPGWDWREASVILRRYFFLSDEDLLTLRIEAQSLASCSGPGRAQ
jgi:hypothetical protein